MAKGGKREGAGRKPKAQEEQLTKMMDRILAPEKFWTKVAKMVMEEEGQAIRIWSAYRYGQPKQTMDVTTGGEKLTSIKIHEPNDGN